MTKTNAKDLFNLRFFEDEEGVHILLSGSLAKDFATLRNTCMEHCRCLWRCHGGGDSDKATA